MTPGRGPHGGPEGFERPERYEEQLLRGVGLSGEGRAFFVAGRLDDLARRLPRGFSPRRVLDVGCGTGETTVELSRRFPAALVFGHDASEPTLGWARERHGGVCGGFLDAAACEVAAPFDLVYANGVLHHVPEADRGRFAAWLRGRLRPGGIAAVYDNNPWNPGARLVMRRIPFDRDARMISIPRLRRILAAAGLEAIGPARTLFYFPRALGALRPLERFLGRLPLGAQFGLLARRPGPG